MSSVKYVGMDVHLDSGDFHLSYRPAYFTQRKDS
jgi:hypothetical protein